MSNEKVSGQATSLEDITRMQREEADDLFRKSTEVSLDILSKTLALNYCDNSVLLQDRNQAEIILGKQINDPEWNRFFDEQNKYFTTRVILVVGAGASASSYPNKIPMGGEVIKKIEKALQVKNYLGVNPEADVQMDDSKNLLSRKFRELEERFRLVWQLDNHQDFESRLATLSNYFTADQIRSQLKANYNHRHKPSFLNEIIAHLFKHRFIDVIINFNFDETLDQAIEEEMLGADYHFIYSDDHCLPIKELTTDQRIKLPVYIKPHGTIKHLSSLRFTKDDYFHLPYDI